ncbi:hypothetical protein Cpin_3907 [Chitinophaga pinensis DSM 2588]|uniref:Uncharacterized protein n=1 Tax=Chitinophaga pinensis (strain ATCC 43595 / DSM 2588 / LMG 13176 / NBRC 15968 / NCIMB 11800 / UQM 2034) TaxID=485918 RepID=A0A979GVH6_CHIPD|nr:hypothetical protein Cpin_3907 [Chitinophaga pinensis DSM 2588]
MAFTPDSVLVRSAIVSPVDFLVPGTTFLFSIPQGYIFTAVAGAQLTIVDSAGTGVGVFSVSAGTNATSYNNLYSSLSPSLAQLTGNTVIPLTAQPRAVNATSGSVNIYISIVGIATGFTTLKGIFYMPYALIKYP